MPDQAAKSARFLALHTPERPLVLANAWDAGSARILSSLGFQALATTSSGQAASHGRLDYSTGPDDAIAHAAAIAQAAGELPVSADLEDCFGDDAPGVARTVVLAREAGLAGFSVEDYGSSSGRLYERGEAVERVAAAVEEAHAGPVPLVVTARAENYLRGNPDLADTIERLLAYQEAGADVLYAPALDAPGELRELLAAVARPVNVLLRPGVVTVPELAELGVSRISVGGALAFAAYGAMARAAAELLEHGTHESFLELAGFGGRTARAAFAEPEA